MPEIAVIYFSQTGVTHTLAEALQRGAEKKPDVSCRLFRIQGEMIEKGRLTDDAGLKLVDQADAVFLGSPTYMGGPAAQFKAFADASSDRWEVQRWRNKLVGGFTTGTSPGGDQLSTLQYFSILATQHGMLWVGLDMPQSIAQSGLNNQGTQIGLSVCAPDDVLQAADINTAEYFGSRVAAFL